MNNKGIIAAYIIYIIPYLIITPNPSVSLILNYSPLNVLTDCLKWEIPKYRSLAASNSLGYPRSSYG
ncbi:hypothetical protein CN520_19305 [Bacillus cereus]|nr:hypothetical protein CON18_25965 [Bacillus cereus]PET39203.1 hypothetical protein CN520_19305 [Bacillus cereus]PFA20116.1 hypothetical protein CN377_00735 [Bacillus cereus]PFS75549.1 hypothetical protein COK49_18065 [Bacillus cereus]PGP95732.1 hypothetical protein COA10_25400 [Bacillus cereus]